MTSLRAIRSSAVRMAETCGDSRTSERWILPGEESVRLQGDRRARTNSRMFPACPWTVDLERLEHPDESSPASGHDVDRKRLVAAVRIVTSYRAANAQL